MLGLFFADAAETLPDADYLKATWLELKVADPSAWKARLQAFGVIEVEFPDPDAVFLSGPGRTGLPPRPAGRRIVNIVAPPHAITFCASALL